MRKTILITAFLTIVCSVYAQNRAEFIEAAQAYSEERFSDAGKAFELLHSRDTTNDAINYYLGLCSFRTGNIEKAGKHLRMAVAADSLNTWYLNSLATLYNATGRYSKAAPLCEKLVKLAPNTYKNSYTLCMIADYNLSQRRDSIATKYYEMALEIDSEYAPAQIGLSEVMRMKGNYPGFFVALDSFIDNQTVNTYIKSNYLKALMESIDGKFFWVWGTQIENLMDKCLAHDPSDIQSHINKAQMHIIRNDEAEMLKEFEAIVPLAKEQKDTTNLLLALSAIGDYHYQHGNRKKAFALYDKALAISPDYAPVLNNYAYYLSEERIKLKKALQMSEITIKQEPDNATYLDTYAWILHLLKRDKEAKPYFKHAMIYGGKESSTVLEHYSEVLKALGEDELSEYYKNLALQKKK